MCKTCQTLPGHHHLHDSSRNLAIGDTPIFITRLRKVKPSKDIKKPKAKKLIDWRCCQQGQHQKNTYSLCSLFSCLYWDLLFCGTHMTKNWQNPVSNITKRQNNRALRWQAYKVLRPCLGSTLSPPKSNQIWPGQRSDSAMPLAPWHRPAEIRNVGVNGWVARPRPSGVSPVGSLKQDSKWFKHIDQTRSNINNGPSDASSSDGFRCMSAVQTDPLMTFGYHFSAPLQ